MHDHVKLPQRVHNCFDVLIQFVDIAVLDPVADRCASSRTCCRRQRTRIIPVRAKLKIVIKE